MGIMLAGTLTAQVPQKPLQARPGIAQACEEIERGIGKADVAAFSAHFARQVAVNIRGGENGYFSANQAYYLLQSYFTAHRAVQFKFTTIGETAGIPFATGGGSFTFRGSKQTVQIYVTFRRSGERWLITQFNAY